MYARAVEQGEVLATARLTRKKGLHKILREGRKPE
jgi:hypothetical protein